MNNGGVMTISRPQADAGKVFSKFPAHQVPLNAQLVVGNDEACLFLKDGAVVGVLPPGQYVLNAEAFPVFQQLIVAGPEGQGIACEIFFIFGQNIAGIRFGGKLTLPMAPGSGGATFVRGTYDYHVIDPGRLIQTVAGIGGDLSQAADQFPPPHVKAKVFSAVQNQIAALVGQQGIGLPELPAAISSPEVQQALGADIQDTAKELGIELLAVRVDAVEQQAEMQPPAPDPPPLQEQGLPPSQGMQGMAQGQMSQPPSGSQMTGGPPPGSGGPHNMPQQQRGFGRGAAIAGGAAAAGAAAVAVGAVGAPHQGQGPGPAPGFGGPGPGPGVGGPSKGQQLNPGARVLGCYEGEWYEATVSQVQPDGVYLNWDDGTASMVSMGEFRPSAMPGPSDIGPGARVMAKYEEVFYECAIASLDSGGATINWDDETQSYVALHDIRLLH